MPNNVEGYKFIFDLISELAAAVSRVLAGTTWRFLMIIRNVDTPTRRASLRVAKMTKTKINSNQRDTPLDKRVSLTLDHFRKGGIYNDRIFK